jgi:predicted NACHT family NTPase
LREQLDRFTEDYRLCSFIITTRIDGFRDVREEDFLNWQIFSIARLNEERVKKFIGDWFEDSAKQKDLLTKLKSPRLWDLASRAFLLALICLVYDEHGELGQSRSELYEQATYFLERSRAGVPARIMRNRRSMLKNIALKYLQLNSQEVDVNLITAMVSEIFPNFTTVMSKKFLEDLAADTGILQNLGGSYVFTHKSLQEYYAALALNDMPNGQDLMLDYCQVSP